jgi:AraC-like DNA-binding protein
MVRKRSTRGTGGRPALPLTVLPMPLPGDLPVWATPHLLESHDLADLHRHDVLELGYCHAGSGIFLVEDKVFPFHAGCALAISPREFHRARSTAGDPSRWTFCFLDPERLIAAAGAHRAVLDPTPLWGRRFPNLLEPGVHPESCDLIRLLCAEATGRRDPAALQGLAWAVMAHLQRLPGRSAGPRTAREAAMTRIAPALAWLGEHGGDDVPVPRLAARCRTSVASFRRWFHAAMGMSPRRYLLQVRVQRAATLLRNRPVSVLEAALDCGFASANGFARRFRSVMGIGPRAWRAGAGLRGSGSTPMPAPPGVPARVRPTPGAARRRHRPGRSPPAAG